MAPLKLVNNTGFESEKNLCFVNTELQLLYSIPDVKDFFALKKYRENCSEKLPLCDELSRIFCTAGRFNTTAAELRRMVGNLYGRDDICNGVQQDLEEFHTLLLGSIDAELEGLGGVNSCKQVHRQRTNKKNVFEHPRWLLQYGSHVKDRGGKFQSDQD